MVDVYEKSVFYSQKIKLLESKYEEMKSEKRKIIEDIEVRKIALDILNRYIDANLTPKIKFIEDIVTEGLNFIFEDNYKFVIKRDVKNNKNVYYFSIVNNGIEGDINSVGGGIMAVVSFLIRFTINIIRNKYKIMVLDESLNHVSESYHEKLSNFIKVISENYGVNIILITHQQKMSIHADLIYNFKNDDGKLVCEKVFENN